MILYRITSKPYIHDFSGTGAYLHGGRWNPKGVRMLYTSESLSLAALEIIASLSSGKISNSLYCVELEFPDHLPIETIKELPEKWNQYPHHPSTVTIGHNFVKNNDLCLKVPSALIPTENNYLINTLHDDAKHLKLIDARPFIIDQRLVK